MADVGGGGSLFDLEGKISLDVSGYESAIADALSSIQELESALDLDSATVTVSADVSDAKSDLADVETSVSDLDGEEAEPTVDADTTEADSAISQVEDDLDELEANPGEVDIDADASEAEAAVQSVSDGIQDIGTESVTAEGFIDSMFGKLSKWVMAGGVGMAITKVASSIKNIATSLGENGDKIDKVSQSLGISRTAYQEWDYVLSQTGGEISDVTASMRSLGNQFKAGTTPAAAFTDGLIELGLSYDELANMSRDKRFSTIVKGLQDYGEGMDEAEANSKRLELAMNLLGRSAGGLAPLLNTSSEETDDLTQAAHDLGMIMSDEDIDAAVNYQDTLDTFQRTLKGIGNSLTSEILTPMTSVLSSITKFIDAISDQTLEEKMAAIGTAYADTVADIASQEIEANAIIDALTALTEFDGLTEEQEAEWNSLKTTLEAIMPGITDLFEDQAGKIKGGSEALKEYKENFFEAARMEARRDVIVAQQKELADAEAALINARVEQRRLETIASGYNDPERQAEALKELAAAYGIAGENYDTFLSYFTEGENIDFANAASALKLGPLSDWEMAAGSAGPGRATKEMMPGYKGIEADSAEAAEASAIYATLTSGVEDANAAVVEHGEELEKLENDYTKAKEYSEEWMAAWDDLDFASMPGKADDAIGETNSSFTSGAKKAVSIVSDMVTKINNTLDNLHDVTLKVQTVPSGDNADSRAVGLRRVPYDDYLTRLHEGERVLTRAEARRYNEGLDGAAVGLDYDYMANSIARAVSRRPIAFSVSGRELATTTRDDASRAAAFRYAQISSGYGRGA